MTADDFPLAGNARKRRNEWASVDEAYDAYASKRPLDVMTPESLRAYVEYGLRDRGDGVFELKCRPEVEARVLRDGARQRRVGALPDDRVVGASSCAVRCRETSRPRSADASRDRLPHGTVEVWPGCGHFGPQQDPDTCAASILRFRRRMNGYASCGYAVLQALRSPSAHARDPTRYGA